MKKSIRFVLLISALVITSLACSLLTFDQFVSPSPTVIEETVEPTPTVQVDEPPITQQEKLVGLYEQVNPGVVAIRVLSEEGGGLGTGFVWDEEGHIVTNFHVVRGSTDLEVDFPSGFKTRAEVIGTDPDSDLAVLKIDQVPEDLTVLTRGDGRELKVGQTVVAIGNPRGLDGTMTIGIISALDRTLDSLREAPGGGNFTAGNIIQTDAAINPGNSGGPLLNLDGEVVGINSAIQTNSIDLTGQPVNSGLGFALSIDMAKNVLPDLIEFGEHAYPYIGIQTLGELNLFVQEDLNLPRASGVYIIEVMEDSPAEEAGLRGASEDDYPAGGDLIVGIDGQEVYQFSDFIGYLLTYKDPGDVVELEVLRGEEELTIDLTLGSRP
jgi:2-alkenal reductase